MRKITGRLIIAITVFMTPLTLAADQFYGGLGLAPSSGQPKFEADGIMNINLGYETEDFGLAGWRFSYTMTNFKHSDNSDVTIKSHIIGAESLFVNKIKSGLTLIGAFGPGLFQSTYDDGNDSETAMDIGLSATGSLRFALSSEMFLSLALHYKNCAVSNDDLSVDGGYQGFFINFGAFF